MVTSVPQTMHRYRKSTGSTFVMSGSSGGGGAIIVRTTFTASR